MTERAVHLIASVFFIVALLGVGLLLMVLAYVEEIARRLRGSDAVVSTIHVAAKERTRKVIASRKRGHTSE